MALTKIKLYPLNGLSYYDLFESYFSDNYKIKYGLNHYKFIRNDILVPTTSCTAFKQNIINWLDNEEYMIEEHNIHTKSYIYLIIEEDKAILFKLTWL